MLPTNIILQVVIRGEETQCRQLKWVHDAVSAIAVNRYSRGRAPMKHPQVRYLVELIQLIVESGYSRERAVECVLEKKGSTAGRKEVRSLEEESEHGCKDACHVVACLNLLKESEKKRAGNLKFSR